MKPASMTMKDWIVGQMESTMGFAPDIVTKVVNFQGEDMLKAVKEHNEIEISGLGIIYVSKKKLANRIKQTNQVLEKWKAREDADKIAFLEDKIKFLNNKQCQSLGNT